jgi:NAD(P)H-dependent FMN reductase
MNILIITQSSPEGLNQKVALECKRIVEGAFELTNQTFNIDIDNSSTVPPGSISNYDRIIMIVPEWNGSFPHTFKALIDSSGWPSSFEEKAVLLVGTSNSDFGNIMGLMHLVHILQWIGAHVNSKRVCINRLAENVDDNGVKDHEQRLYKAINAFIK